MLIRAETVSQSYAMTAEPKYLVLLKGAGHFSFTELSKKYQATIAAYATAFFDRTLKEKPAPRLDQPAGNQVAQYEHRP